MARAQLAELRAFNFWSGRIVDGHLPKDTSGQSLLLQEQLISEFGIADGEACDASNFAIRALTEVEYAERAAARESQDPK